MKTKAQNVRLTQKSTAHVKLSAGLEEGVKNVGIPESRSTETSTSCLRSKKPFQKGVRPVNL